VPKRPDNQAWRYWRTVAGAAATIYLPFGWTPAKAAAKWKVGFSQCTTLEPWRVQFNKDIQAEAKNHPDVDLIITDGQDKTQKQVADCENLVVQQVNVLLISPKESAGLTGVVEKAIDAKIPVIVLDRNVDTKRITQFIGGDNVAKWHERTAIRHHAGHIRGLSSAWPNA